MKVQNMTSNSTGREVVNQFIITDDNGTVFFQSYNSIIAKKEYKDGRRVITLDEYYWDYSKTTGKYRNQFLEEDKAATQAKIDCGTYQLANLNS